jgi:DNA-binding response OmpR family regulator
VQPSDLESSSDNPRILIVSPAADIRATYPAYLRSHGMVVDVDVAEDLIDRFAKAVEDPPAVVIVDDAAPAAAELLNRLRVVTRTRHASRLVLVSAVPLDKELEHAAAVLLKPVSPQDIHGKVVRLVLDWERSKRGWER